MNVEPHHTPEELKTLYRTEMNTRLARRIHGIYLARMGRTCPEILRITGTARRTVQKWLERYNHGGIDELFDKPRPGAPTKLPASQERQVLKRIKAGPQQSDTVSVFNARAIQRIIEREYGVLYSLTGLYDWLHRMGFSYLCPRPLHEKSDPAARESFKKTFPKQWLKLQSNIPTSE